MSQGTWVKICGITSAGDAAVAVNAGADALGFNLWPRSKRYLELEAATPWLRDLAGKTERVAVMVNPTLDEARRVAEHPAIDTVQFHGDESPEFLAEFGKLGHPFLIARRLSREHPVDLGAFDMRQRVLIDTAVPGEFGGTGVLVDTALAREFVASSQRPVILAGGLNPANVAETIAIVLPYGVDVASGVEQHPGVKDSNKVQAFIAAAKQ